MKPMKAYPHDNLKIKTVLDKISKYTKQAETMKMLFALNRLKNEGCKQARLREKGEIQDFDLEERVF